MDKFLAHVANKDLLIIEDYAVIRRVTEQDAGNITKEQLVPFADFASMPLVVMSGMKSINLLNVKTGR